MELLLHQSHSDGLGGQKRLKPELRKLGHVREVRGVHTVAVAVCITARNFTMPGERLKATNGRNAATAITFQMAITTTTEMAVTAITLEVATTTIALGVAVTVITGQQLWWPGSASVQQVGNVSVAICGSMCMCSSLTYSMCMHAPVQ